MTDAELNSILSELDARADRGEIDPPAAVMKHGKAIPYMGWYWRDVDFSEPLTLARSGEYVAFCEKNKWDYDEWLVTAAFRDELRVLLVKAAQEPTHENLKAVYLRVQEGRQYKAESWADAGGRPMKKDAA